MSWADSQEQFSLGAETMSQGSGSPITFLDPITCNDIMADLRRADGQLPDFGSVGSEPGSPPLALELEVTHCEREAQTSPSLTQDQATQVLSRPHQGTSSTEIPAPASTSDQGQQALLRPPCSVAFTQTAKPATSRTTTWTQTHRLTSNDIGTEMPQVLTVPTGCQAGTLFDNEVIPPGVPRPKLP